MTVFLDSIFFFFLQHSIRDLSSQSGTYWSPLQWKHSLNYWTAREVPVFIYFLINIYVLENQNQLLLLTWQRRQVLQQYQHSKVNFSHTSLQTEKARQGGEHTSLHHHLLSKHYPGSESSLQMDSVVSNSLSLHGLYPARLFCPWNFPGKNICCCFLLQGTFPTQGSNSHLLNGQVDSFTTESPGMPSLQVTIAKNKV